VIKIKTQARRESKHYCKFCRARLAGGKGQGARNHCKKLLCEKKFIDLRKKKQRLAKRRYREKLKLHNSTMKKIAKLRRKGLIE